MKKHTIGDRRNCAVLKMDAKEVLICYLEDGTKNIWDGDTWFVPAVKKNENPI